jgi:hypothetical protein
LGSEKSNVNLRVARIAQGNLVPALATALKEIRNRRFFTSVCNPTFKKIGTKRGVISETGGTSKRFLRFVFFGLTSAEDVRASGSCELNKNYNTFKSADELKLKSREIMA